MELCPIYVWLTVQYQTLGGSYADFWTSLSLSFSLSLPPTPSYCFFVSSSLPHKLQSVSSTQQDCRALLGFLLTVLRSRKCLQAGSHSNCRVHYFCFLSLTVTVLLCLLLMSERSYFIHCVQFSCCLRRKD